MNAILTRKGNRKGKWARWAHKRIYRKRARNSALPVVQTRPVGAVRSSTNSLTNSLISSPVSGLSAGSILGRTVRFIGRALWRMLWWVLEGPQLIRVRGPGLRPEEQHEFITADAREAFRRTGWL